MVEHGHSHSVECGAYVKTSERVHQLGEVEVAHLQSAGAGHAIGTIDNSDAHRFDAGQVIIEAWRCVQGCVDLESPVDVRFDRPGAGPTARRHGALAAAVG